MCSGIRRSFGGGEGFRAYVQAVGKPMLATFRSWPQRTSLSEGNWSAKMNWIQEGSRRQKPITVGHSD